MEEPPPINSLTHESNSLARELVDWLYLPRAYTDWLRRGVGLCGLSVGIIVWTWTHGGPGPYTVPAWRIGDSLLYLPVLPSLVDITLFVAYGLCCVALIFGRKEKFFAALPVLVLAFYGSRDLMAADFHFDVLLWVMFVALLFDRPGPNPCRRIIQISMSACYFYAALCKMLYPEFVSGNSFESMFNTGLATGETWATVIQTHPFSHAWWIAFSWLTIAGEFFFAFAFFVKKIKRPALLAAFIFHGGIALFLDRFLLNFTVVMWTGLIAFFDKKEPLDAQSGSISWTASRRLEATLAAAFCMFLALFPARDYFRSERPLTEMTGFDRSPWSYCMYLQLVQTTAFDLDYLTSDGIWHRAPFECRMKASYTNNDIYAAAHHVFATVPDASEVKVCLRLRINLHINEERTLDAKRDQPPGKVEVRRSTN